jgi:hypothetical protein
MDEYDDCQHVPGFWDKIKYYAHTVLEPCRFGGPTVARGASLCLTSDWIEKELACPRCITEKLGSGYVVIHPEEE